MRKLGGMLCFYYWVFYIIGALYSLTLFDKLGTFALVYIISCIISSIICFSLDNTAKSTKRNQT